MLAGLQSDEEVRDVFPLRAVPQIENMEAEVIALGVGGDVLGALDFVVKPFDKQRLQSLFQTYLHTA